MLSACHHPSDIIAISCHKTVVQKPENTQPKQSTINFGIHHSTPSFCILHSNAEMKNVILFIGNAAMHLAWLNVLFILLKGYFTNGGFTLETCEGELRPSLQTALLLAGIEFFNSILKFTKSKPHQVLLFSSVRFGIEYLTAPLLPCSRAHLWTVTIWAFGDMIRCGCFALETGWSLMQSSSPPPSWIRSIRYTVGPILFPLGAGGEMIMVILAAMDGRPKLYMAASLWPAGFYPLMKQLLRQRKKHFNKLRAEHEKNA
jgi:hypothetical protein